jgi:hypothetical protein
MYNSKANASHADTIRRYLDAEVLDVPPSEFQAKAHAALDALLAEIQQLRDALHRHLLNDALQNGYDYEGAKEFADEAVFKMAALAAVRVEDER